MERGGRGGGEGGVSQKSRRGSCVSSSSSLPEVKGRAGKRDRANEESQWGLYHVVGMDKGTSKKVQDCMSHGVTNLSPKQLKQLKKNLMVQYSNK